LAGLLVLATAVSLAIGETLDAAAIAAIVLINALLGFLQEAGAERAVRALRASAQPVARVRRSGRELTVPSSGVVRGDVVVLREGDRVVADGQLGEAFGLEIDESMLTGESVPVAKDAGPGDGPAVYAGTAVTRGRGTALAVAVGESTRLAHIANLTDAAVSPPTPLQRRLASLTRQMVALGFAITALLAAVMLLRGSSFREAFLVGVSVAVAAVPEGLAPTVTITLALAARAMARRHAIVRRLDAAETLGEVSVICTDKTGTLTENRLRVASVGPRGEFRDADVLTAGLLASAPMSASELAEPQAGGDPLEHAIARGARAAGLDREAIVDEREFLDEVPFDSARRRMTRVWREGDDRYSYVKGAPESIVAASLLTDAGRAEIERQAEAWAASGMRVLAVARRALPAGAATDVETLEDGLTMIGLIAFEDPLRPSARSAVHDAHAAGIAVHMLTGDHAATASAIAAELGIPAERVASRIDPEEKLRIVERFQAQGQVVAVTGDGINDAPALRQADIGVAMGGTGTEAAREAADVILTDDDFSTIVAAVREGRIIADNVRKVTAFLLSANLGEVILFAVAISAGLGVPMSVFQVLVVNLLTDGLPAIALARDPASADTMLPRRQAGAALFSKKRWLRLIAIGMAVGLVALIAYLIGRADNSPTGQTMAFGTVALAELVLVFTFRSEYLPFWRLSANPLLALGCMTSAAMVALLIYLPSAHDVVDTASLSINQLMIIVILALVPGAFAEVAKNVVWRASCEKDSG
jgi:Ca2+-transporting ATPase